MTVYFSLEYKTSFGENLSICTGKHTYAMHYNGNGVWETTLTGTQIRHGQDYTYILMRDGRIIRREWRTHCFKAPNKAKEVTVCDR